MTILFNRRELLRLRRELRRRQTPAEKRLWRELRRRNLDGIKFYRQYSADNYILDFYCATHHLGIEVDGPYHLEEAQQKKDKKRTAHINGFNIKIIRFTNDEVLTNTPNVLARIREELEARRSEETPP